MAAARPATLNDVASEAGVSLATASRALNGSDRVVREELRRRVIAAAEKLGYTANAQAQAMARGSTDVVGLLVNDIADPYFSTIAAGVADAADQQGLLVMLCSTGGSGDRELEFMTALTRQRGRAIILAGSRTADRAHLRDVTRQLEVFIRAGGRVAAITQPRLPVDTVVVENRRAARDMATNLYALGYRRPLVVAGPDNLLVSRERREGFTAGWKAATRQAPALVAEEFSRDGGFRSMDRFLGDPEPVDCVFAVNDLMALGAMAACRSHDVRIPADLAVAGFDDISTLRDVSPGLSTVRLPLAEMGRTALDLVLAPETTQPRRLRISGEVVLRESTPGI